MLTARTILDTPLVTVEEVRCSGGPATPGAEEGVGRYQVVLPRDGLFVRWRGRRAVVADPTHALLYRPGDGYRTAHPTGCGDTCTSILPGPGALDALLGTRPDWTHAPTSASDDLAHRRLVAGLRARALSRLGAEELAVGLLGRIGATAAGVDARAASDACADRAREALAARFADEVTLDELARAAGCSPFHLCRAFRRRTGLTLRRYQRRLRVRAALERLDGGAADLTALALDLGFYDHSHFSNAFRAETGVAPSAWRAASNSVQAGAQCRR